MPAPPEWLVIGKVLAPFGTKGEFRVMSQTDFPQRFEPGRALYVEREAAAFTVERCRWQKGQAVLKLAGVDDRDRAEELHGRYLRVPGSDPAPLGEGEYYLFQVIGLRVVTDDGRELGTVSEVLQNAANDVYVVQGAQGELLLPAIADVVQQVDLNAGVLRVHLLPGLLTADSEEIR